MNNKFAMPGNWSEYYLKLYKVIKNISSELQGQEPETRFAMVLEKSCRLSACGHKSRTNGKRN